MKYDTITPTNHVCIVNENKFIVTFIISRARSHKAIMRHYHSCLSKLFQKLHTAKGSCSRKLKYYKKGWWNGR